MGTESVKRRNIFTLRRGGLLVKVSFDTTSVKCTPIVKI